MEGRKEESRKLRTVGKGGRKSDREGLRKEGTHATKKVKELNFGLLGKQFGLLPNMVWFVDRQFRTYSSKA